MVKSSAKHIVELLGIIRIHLVKFVKSTAYELYFFRIFNTKFAGLNLGSDGTRIEDFCNIDASPRALCDIVARIEKLKLNSNSVGVIYSSHVFEHIPMAKAKKVLVEWHRVLEPGGKLYICVPDAEVLFRVYLDNLSLYNTEEGKSLVDMACFFTYGAQRNKYDYHFYGYSFTTLKALLQSVGFKNVQRFYRKELKIVPFHDSSLVKIRDIDMSLNVEASK
jgi:predicted SAM-dependent methyltransferase